MTTAEIIAIVALMMQAPPEHAARAASVPIEHRPLSQLEVLISTRGKATLALYWQAKVVPVIVLTPGATDDVLAHEFCHVFQDLRGESFEPSNMRRLEEECDKVQYNFFINMED